MRMNTQAAALTIQEQQAQLLISGCIPEACHLRLWVKTEDYSINDDDAETVANTTLALMTDRSSTGIGLPLRSVVRAAQFDETKDHAVQPIASLQSLKHPEAEDKLALEHEERGWCELSISEHGGGNGGDDMRQQHIWAFRDVRETRRP